MNLLNRVAHMDIFDLCDCIDDNKVDMILCDLPYGEINNNKRLRSGGLRQLYKFKADDIDFSIQDAALEFNRIAKSWIYMFCGINQISILRKTFEQLGCMTRLGIWHKSNPSPLNAQHMWLSSIEACVIARKSNAKFNNFYSDCVWNYPTGKSEYHPTQKPIQLFEYLIMSSTQPGEVVFDPCVGSGTTAIAARNTGRNFVVGDNSAEYVDIARKRLDKPYTMPMFDEQPTQDDKAQQMGMFDNAPLQDEGE